VAGIEELVDGGERSYADAQQRMSEPSVYNDHREAAEVGRRLKELEAPHRLAQEWLGIRSDLDDAHDDAELRELVPDLERRLAGLEDALKLPLVQTDPADRKAVSG